MIGKTLIVLALACAAGGGAAAAIEGKWTPEQLVQLDARWLRELGLQITPEALWNPTGSGGGGGLLEAAVRISGCSAGFVSAEGLLITNHHCAFAILQQHSTPERDLITAGYLAAGRDRELPGSGVRATIPLRVSDVTAAIEGSLRPGDDLARYRGIERRKKELVADCERAQNRRCEVAAFDGGVRYLLFENLEYPDVRLVYAPPRGVGDFGGETDNWSWPRHSGDFALLRVYCGPDGKPAARSAASVPYRPRHFFPVSAHGVHPGDFVLVAGYPGLTFRSLLEIEMREREELLFPRRAALFRAWLDLMEGAARRDEAARIALADRIKGLANREKNARGQIAGLARGRVLERKHQQEQVLLAWIAKQRDPWGAAAARLELIRLYEQRLATFARVPDGAGNTWLMSALSWEHDFLLQQMRSGTKALDLALTLVRRAREAVKPDLDREPEYMDRNRARLEEGLRRDQQRLHPATEAALLGDLLGRFAALPEASRVAAVEALLAAAPAGGAEGRPDAGPGSGKRAADPAALQARAAGLLAGSRVLDLYERIKMFRESEEQLRARHDPLLDLALALDGELRDAEEREHRYQGAASRLRPHWQLAVAAQAGKPIAPDANGTLRVSLAHVQGYSPKAGATMTPQTSVAGMVAKHTGSEPFDAPEALRAAAPRAAESRWSDPVLRDVPVCFLADADTTGGNSGSPVLNGRGELVGVNFDRVWENVANDFGYDPEVARNISVDLRYLFWVLEVLHSEAARPLLDEMGVLRSIGRAGPDLPGVPAMVDVPANPRLFGRAGPDPDAAPGAPAAPATQGH
ncbi:MAG TPA: S46 family peptidase [Thermoanaerobaculia bacterium]|nr:S46 family peptidase [Thermoanaerobaculia bacterium]